MLDISIPGLMMHQDLIWIDHHKSAMEKWDNGPEGYRIDGVAACRLAWQWSFQMELLGFLPSNRTSLTAPCLNLWR